MLKIILSAVDSSLSNAWKEYCGELPNVTVHEGSILDLQCDAVVSPANSFGFMDGGIDAQYMEHFGTEIESAVRRSIQDFYSGELLVGQAAIVETNANRIPFLIAAPTMRVPMILKESVNAYLAARAVFLLIAKERFKGGSLIDERISDYVQSVAIPGLGTGVGRIPAKTCALQVKKAILDFLQGEFVAPKSWGEASEGHQLLFTNKPRLLQLYDNE